MYPYPIPFDKLHIHCLYVSHTFPLGFFRPHSPLFPLFSPTSHHLYLCTYVTPHRHSLSRLTVMLGLPGGQLPSRLIFPPSVDIIDNFPSICSSGSSFWLLSSTIPLQPTSVANAEFISELSRPTPSLSPMIPTSSLTITATRQPLQTVRSLSGVWSLDRLVLDL